MPCVPLRRWLAPRPSARPRRGRRRFGVEVLEDRTTPALLSLGQGLSLDGDFQGNQATGGSVWVGFTPVGSEPFRNLLEIDLGTAGTVQLDQGAGTFAVASGSIDLVATTGLDLTVSTIGATPVTISAAQLLGTGGQGFSSNTSQSVMIAGAAFTLGTLYLNNPDTTTTADSVARLQGTLGFAGVDARIFSFEVSGGNYVTAAAAGLRLNGAQMNASLPGGASLFGMGLVTGGLQAQYTDDPVKGDIFTVTGQVGFFAAKFGAPNDPNNSKGVQVGLGVQITDGAVTGVSGDLSVGATFQADRVQFQVKQGQFNYDFGEDQFELSGELLVQVTSPNDPNQSQGIDLILGTSPPSANNPGLVIKGGTLEAVTAYAKANFTLFGVSFAIPDQLSFQYTAAAGTTPGQFSMSGGVTVSWGTANPVSITAELLGGAQPGLVLQGGVLQRLDLLVSGGFGFGLPGGLAVGRGTAGQAVNVVWTTQNGQDAFGIAGQFNLTSVFDASVSLGTVGGPYGITVVNGDFDLASVDVQVGSINLGAFQIQDLTVGYTRSQSTNTWTLNLDLQLLFPGGWQVGGELTLVNGAVDSVEIDYAATGDDDGIPLGDSGLFLTYADLSVTNLQSPTLPVSVGGDVVVTFGPQASLPDPRNPTDSETVGLVAAQGSFSVSGEELAVSGGVYLGAYVTARDPNTGRPTYAGLLGSGTGYVNLDWAARVYSAGLDYQMLDGTFQVRANFEFKGGGDDYFLFIDAEADLAVPKFVPVVGGLRLASADFILDYEDDDGTPVGFVAGWVDVLGEVVGVKYDIGAGAWSVFGKAEADALHDCEQDPESCLTVMNDTFVYQNSFTAPAGATKLVMSVDWADDTGTQTLAVAIPGAGVIPQANWGDPPYAAYGITLLPASPTSPTRRQVSLVGAVGQAYTLLPAGSYQLQLVSSVEFNHPPAFTAGFGYPKPTAGVASAANDPNDGNKVIVTVSGLVDQAFMNQVTARLFIQPTAGGNLTPMPAKVLSSTSGPPPGGSPPNSRQYTITAEIDLTDRFFQDYYVFAAVGDGVNDPVYSPASAAAVSSAAPLNGTVTNTAPGYTGQAVSGIRVYVDAGGDGVYDAGTDPSGVTDTNGGYTLSNPAGLLTPGRTYPVRLVLPPGTTQVSPATPPPFTYQPGGPTVDLDFQVLLSAGVSGVVFEDTAKNGQYDGTQPGVPGIRAYVDMNSNGQFDPGVDPSAVTLTQGDFHIYGLSVGEMPLVRLVLPPAFYYTSATLVAGQTVNQPDQQLTGYNFGVLPKVRISGTVAGYPLDQSGVLSPTKEALPNWTVSLLQNGQVVATTMTDPGGNYQFVVEDGTYTVAQGLQPGWRQLAPFTPDLQINPSGLVSDLPWQPDPTAATADLDGDGFLDLVVDRVGFDTDRNVHILWGNGTGSFSLDDSTTLAPGVNQNVILADTSGSGRPDVLLWDTSGDVSRFQNQGGRNFAGLTQIASVFDQLGQPGDVDVGTYDVTAGDLDGDGRDDVVVLWYAATTNLFTTYSYGFSIFYADGSSGGPYFVDGLTPPIQGDKGNAGTQGQGLVKVVDLRNTGVNDLVFAGYFHSGNKTNITVGLNDGTGKNFAWQTGTAPPATNLAFNDIDGDGLPDVLFLNAGGPATTLSYLHNQYVPATGTSPASVAFVPFGAAQPALVLPGSQNGNKVYNLNTYLADMNGDLRPDVVAFGQVENNQGNPQNNWIWVWTNTGGGAYFSQNPQANPNYGVANTNFSTSALGDLDRDGLNDVVIAETSLNWAIVFTNLSAINPTVTVTVKPATAATQDFVNGQIGQLTGAVYDDANRNGAREAGDRPLAGVRVYVDRNANGVLDAGEPVATTGADGAYGFAGLGAGPHVVRVLPPPSHIPGVAGDAVTVGPGRAAVGTDFLLLRRWLQPVADATAARGSAVDLTVAQTGAATNPRLRFLLDPGSPAGAAIDPRTGRFTWTAPSAPGRYTFTARLHDAFDPVMTEAATFTVLVPGARPGPAGPLPPFLFSVPPSAPQLPTAPDFAAFPIPADRAAVYTAVAGFGGWVRVFDYAAGAERFRFRPFGDFAGEVRVAVADVTGDGIPDVVVGAGAGGGPRVVVFDGDTGAMVSSVFAFDPAYTGGVSVAAGDVNGDGFADVAVSQDGDGGAEVAVFDGRTLAPLARFRPFEGGFAGGVRVAVGDVNRDGSADLVVTAGDGGGPRVAVFDGAAVGAGTPARLVADFFVMDPGLRTGFYASVGDVDGDGFGDILVGAGRGGGPRVVVVDGRALVETGAAVVVADFFAGDAGDRGGVRVRAADLDADGWAELLAAAGPGPRPTAYLFDPLSGRRRDGFYAFPFDALGGIEVG